MEMKLKLDDSNVGVDFTGRELRIDGRPAIIPTRASLDVKRVIPLWYTVIIIIGIVLVSMVVGSLFGQVHIAIISVSAGMGLGAIVFMALSRMEQVLVVERNGEDLEFRGPADDLRKLYYAISKVTIKKMKEKERESERASYKGAGITKGDSYLEKDDLKNVRGDLKRSVVLGNRMVTQICPECGNDELYYEGGFITGHVYHCKRCDYVGSFVLEKELDLKS